MQAQPQSKDTKVQMKTSSSNTLTIIDGTSHFAFIQFQYQLVRFNFLCLFESDKNIHIWIVLNLIQDKKNISGGQWGKLEVGKMIIFNAKLY